MKIITINARGLNTPHKRRLLAAEAQHTRADIVCIQETHFKHNRVPALATKDYPIQYHSTYSTKARGVTILIHKLLSFDLLQLKKDTQGRYLIIQCTINDAIYTIAGIYSPNQNQRNFLHK
ncbi:Hypothetical predicted protein, partial [Pelobates cultripes]